MKTKNDFKDQFLLQYLHYRRIAKHFFWVSCVCIAFIALIRWEGVSAAVTNFEWESMLKYYFIATGCALYLITLSNLWTKINVRQEREKLHKGLDKIKEQIEVKKQCVRLDSPAEFRSEEELKTLLQIKKLERKQFKIEAQIELLS